MAALICKRGELGDRLGAALGLVGPGPYTVEIELLDPDLVILALESHAACGPEPVILEDC